MNQHDLGLPPDAFWSDPLSTYDVTVDALLQDGRPSFFIDAPATVEVSQRETLPVVAIRAAALTPPSFEDAAVAVAVDLVSGRAHVGMAIAQDYIREPADGEVPLGGALAGQGFVIDVRERLDLPWYPGEWLISLLYQDQATNRVRVRLTPPASAYRDPAVEAFLEEQRRQHVPAVYPPSGQPLPRYGQQDASPPIPDDVGVSLTAKRVNVMGAEAGCPVYGSYCLPVSLVSWVPPPEEEGEGIAPTAVVPITLVGTGSVDPAPQVARLLVPNFVPRERIEEAGEVRGYFAVDLCALTTAGQQEQTLFLYAFAGEAMAGPVPAAFVSEAQIRR